MKLKRLAFWILLLILLGAMVFFAMRPEPVPVDFAAVQRGPMRVTVDEEGKTRVRNRYLVSSPLTGRVLRIELEPGDPVKKGQVVAVIQPADPVLLDARTRAEIEAQIRSFEAAVGQAEAEKRRIAKELEFARSELGRQKSLESKGVVSRQQLEAAETEVESRSQALEAAEYAVGVARENLEMARARLVEAGQRSRASRASPQRPVAVPSPVSGVVLRRLRQSEAMVPAGEPLIELGNAANLEIVADLLSTDAVKVKPGDRVLIEEWGGERPLNGRVRMIEPSGFTKISALGVEEQRVNVLIDFTDPSEMWSALGDEFRVEVRIVIWERDDVVKVPTSSLFRQKDQWAVFLSEDGRAVLREVQIGRRNGLEAEVLEGLSEGDRVIAYPSDEVKDGVEVVARS